MKWNNLVFTLTKLFFCSKLCPVNSWHFSHFQNYVHQQPMWQEQLAKVPQVNYIPLQPMMNPNYGVEPHFKPHQASPSQEEIFGLDHHPLSIGAGLRHHYPPPLDGPEPHFRDVDSEEEFLENLRSQRAQEDAQRNIEASYQPEDYQLPESDDKRTNLPTSRQRQKPLSSRGRNYINKVESPAQTEPKYIQTAELPNLSKKQVESSESSNQNSDNGHQKDKDQKEKKASDNKIVPSTKYDDPTPSKTSTRYLVEKSTTTEAPKEMPPDPTKVPLEITSHAMAEPDGAVTVVTEMLYDIDNDPFKTTNMPPPQLGQSPFILPTNTEAYPTTHDPRVGPHSRPPPPGPPYGYTYGYTRGPYGEPIHHHHNHHNHHKSYSSSSSPKAPVTGSDLFPPTTSPYDYTSPITYVGSKTNKRYHTTPRPTQAEETQEEPQAGLGPAAISGIVIGSLVCVALLAGATLFVAYRTSFGAKVRSPGTLHGTRNLSTGTGYLDTTSDSNTANPTRVYRWPRRGGDR